MTRRETPPSDDAAPQGRPAARSTPHAFLRSATRSAHAELDQAFSTADIATAAGLGSFLMAQAKVVPPLEDWLEHSGVHAILPDWAERRRTAALAADLRTLGLPRVWPRTAFDLSSPEHILGALYVLEGSRLGGRLLARRVAASADPIVRSAVAFLGHRGPAGGWGVFLTVLNGRTYTAVQLERLCEGAAMCFDRFREAASIGHAAFS